MKTPPFLPAERLQALIDLLIAEGRTVLAPIPRDGALLYQPIETASEIVAGISVHQAPGSYQLSRGDGRRRFAWANGPQALKPLTFAPSETLWVSEQQEDGTLHFVEQAPHPEPLAVIGVRGCDLAALALQRQHFLSEPVDAAFAARVDALLLIAVNCTHPSANCFCASTGDGPGISSGADIQLWECDAGYFLRGDSAAGRRLVDRLDTEAGDPTLFSAALQEVSDAGIQALSLPEHARQIASQHPARAWQDIAAQCLSCGNCTQVCPTCFCHSETAVPDISGQQVTQQRHWDSCFTADHAYLHGHQLRPATVERYRQWLTHKFDYWFEQYGRSGCTGCGRCISWCPVGINPLDVISALEEEAKQLC